MKHIITILLILLGLFLYTRGHASEYRPNARMEMKYFVRPSDLTAKDKVFYNQKLTFHLDNARRCYEDARYKCWYLPHVSDRDAAKACFASAIATVGASTVRGKLVMAVTSLLAAYGLESVDEWDYINNKLWWSNYHFEMADFYRELLDA